MCVFKFLHAADLHLDSPMVGLDRYPGSPVEEVRLATRQALDQLVTLAINEAVSFVVIAGDLYDGNWKDFNTGLYFNQAMSRLQRDGGIRAYVVSGNHDAESQIQKHLNLPSNVTWFPAHKPATERIDSLGVAIHGQSHRESGLTDNLAIGFPAPMSGCFNIGLLHTAVDGRAGHQPYAPCKVHELQDKGYDYWALGHVHRAQVLCENPWIVFPGNTQGRSVRETGPKGCTIVTVEHDKVARVESRPLDVLRWAHCVVDATGCAHARQVLDRVTAQLTQERQAAADRMLAVRVEVTGATDAHGELTNHLEHWTAEIRSLATELGSNTWVEKVKVSTWPALNLDELRRRQDPVGELVRAIERIEAGTESFDTLLADDPDLAKDLDELRRTLNKAQLTDWDLPTGELMPDVKNLLVSRLVTGAMR